MRNLSIWQRRFVYAAGLWHLTSTAASRPALDPIFRCIGLSLKCYSCGALIGPNDFKDCESFEDANWDRHKISHCHFPDAVCAKYIVDYSGQRWVHRDCKHHDVCSFLTASYSNDMNMLLECETCANEDLCNSAWMQVPGLVIVLAVLSCVASLI